MLRSLLHMATPISSSRRMELSTSEDGRRPFWGASSSRRRSRYPGIVASLPHGCPAIGLSPVSFPKSSTHCTRIRRHGAASMTMAAATCGDPIGTIPKSSQGIAGGSRSILTAPTTPTGIAPPRCTQESSNSLNPEAGTGEATSTP